MVSHKTNTPLSPQNILKFIFKEERRGSLALILAAVLALLLANSSWSDHYFTFWSTQLHFGALNLDVKHWVSEGLMAVFFLVAGLEVKREFIDGELRSWQKASFPVLAAAGGMLVPALIFSVFNAYSPQSSGWAIPMATDIAIAAGVIGLLGDRIPKILRIFLLTLAIVDDIGSILIIGFFYNQPTNIFVLLLAVVLCVGLLIVRKWKFWPAAFLIIGLAVWYCLTSAGVSGTMAGVILAFLMPLKTRAKTVHILQMSEKIEDVLIPLTTFFIVPLFVLANAGIRFSSMSFAGNGSRAVFTGVFCGLLFGKPAGILLASWLGHRLKVTRKPDGIRWSQLAGIGFIGGIGFTISLLIADLAYPEAIPLQSAAILGVFIASIVSGVIGLLVLLLTTQRRTGAP